MIRIKIYDILQKLEFWIIFYGEEYCYTYKVCNEILLHIENNNKLQYNSKLINVNQS